MIEKINKQLYKMFSNKKILKSIKSHADSNISTIGQALDDVLSDRVKDDETAFVGTLENLRKELYNSDKTIEIIDYGAFSSDLNLSEDQMYEGKKRQKTVGQIARASKPFKYAFLLYKLARYFKPENALELGTCVGMSASYQGYALQLNNKGNMYTIEGDPSIGEIARENYKKAGVTTVTQKIGRFQDVLPELLKSTKFDFVFIDGHHDKDATLKYFDQIYPSLKENSIVIFDDISWSKGMKEAWEQLINDKRVSAVFDLFYVGICIVNSDLKKEYFKLAI